LKLARLKLLLQRHQLKLHLLLQNQQNKQLQLQQLNQPLHQVVIEFLQAHWLKMLQMQVVSILVLYKELGQMEESSKLTLMML